MALVEKESAQTKAALTEHEKENRTTFEKHAAELGTANTQVALVAAALESIKTALNDLKTDVKEWMRQHSQPSE